MAILDNWIDDLPQQFQGKKYIEALISAFSKQIGELHEVFNELGVKTDLEGATGKNLDMVGDIVSLTRKEAGLMAGVGIDEPVISDDRYRQFLKYKILRNTNDCTYYDIMQSIEILWDTSNIKYVEDPSRPATILIRLQTINVDSDVDPAVGKTMAVKPAGVALIYTVNYIVIVDSSQLERFLFPKMRMHIAIPFWRCRMFDGAWLLDGSCLLDAQRNYEARPGMKVWCREFKTIESADTEALVVSFRQPITERIRMPTMAIHSRLDFWDLTYLDGAKKLDGKILLDASRIRMPTATRLVYRGIGTEEDFDNFVLIKRKNLWYLDASLKLDGSNTLNAKIEKEDF